MQTEKKRNCLPWEEKHEKNLTVIPLLGIYPEKIII